MQVHDRMTEQVYSAPLQSFRTDTVPTPVFTVPVMAQGAAALQQINEVRLSFCSCCIKLFEGSVLLVGVYCTDSSQIASHASRISKQLHAVEQQDVDKM